MSNSTEQVIERMIEGIQRMIKMHDDQGQGEGEGITGVIQINPAMKKHSADSDFR
jgi:hypothetical protein